MEVKKALKCLPGFPCEGRFQTKEEVDEYFSHEKIQCLLCGRWFRNLPTHLRLSHDEDVESYRATYGLPWRRGLSGTESRNLRSEQLKKRIEDGFKSPIIHKNVNRKRKSGRETDQPYYRNLKAKHLDKVRKTDVKYVYADYKKLLTLMIQEQTTLKKICQLYDDLPSEGHVHLFARTNKKFRKELDETFKKLPFNVQALSKKLGDDFHQQLNKAKEEGLTRDEIAKKLNVGRTTIKRHFYKGE